MVRHYYLRRGPNVADLRVNLVHKHDRVRQSHGLTLRPRNAPTRLEGSLLVVQHLLTHHSANATSDV